MAANPRMLNAALGYAGLGWPVIPVEPRGKRPLIQRWPEWGNSHADVLIAAWNKYPEANIGLVTGVAFDVLDIDGPKGRETLDRLLDEPYSHEGPAVKTGRGLHLYFAPTGEGNRGNPDSKLDYRGRGGFVVAPPSIHPDGHRYTWTSHGASYDLPEAPWWLRKWLAPPAVPAQAPKAPSPLADGIRASRPPILEVAQSLGLRLHRGSRAWLTNCIFHDDSTPSLALYVDNDTFTCFGCNVWGDSHDLQARRSNPGR